MRRNKVLTNDFLLGIILLITISFITVGYAVFYRNLGLNGNLTIAELGKVRISLVELDTSKTNNTLQEGVLDVDTEGNLTLNFSTTVSREEITYQGTYLVYVTNDSPFDYTYTGVSLNPEVTIPNGSSSDGGATVEYEFDTTNSKNTLLVGDTIVSGETRIAAIILKITVGSQNSNVDIEIGGEGNVNSTVDNSGELYGAIEVSELDLSGGVEKACFNVEVINTYKYRRSFTLKSSNENFYLTDESGATLSDLYIDEPSDTDSTQNVKSYRVCLKPTDGSIFLTDTAKTSIVLSSNELLDQAIKELTVKVDIQEATDEDIPEIQNVLFTIGKYDQDAKTLTTNVSWTRLDTGGTSITGYTIQLYNATTDTLVQTYVQNNDMTSYQIIMDETFLTNNKTAMVTNNNDYYVKVYGTDEAGNTGSTYCSLSDGNTYCVASANTKLKWEFDVTTTNLNYMSLSTDSPTKAYIGNTYQATLTPDSSYSLPSSITVTMNGTTLEVNTDYTYSAANSGALNITTAVTGDITIAGTASYSGGVCLVEGTKIKLADGTYKNIENIEYTDLIQAFSHDTGKIVYEYPIWIEKEGKLDHYQKTTFSDGTILKTVGSHGVFSSDANKYVSVLDRNLFDIGTKVIKINKDNQKEIVEVTKIETIEEDIKYYHVSSTRYHNSIANDLLTTDAMLIISNMFPFNKDMTWAKEREKFLKKNDLFYYKDWLFLFPSHIFKGFRMAEAKYLFNKGQLNILMFADTLNGLIKPTMKNEKNKNLWMVTTSDEFENKNKGKLYEEGSYYTLPTPIEKENKTFKGWYNTADNKIYQINDKVEVDYGMYFEAIWE